MRLVFFVRHLEYYNGARCSINNLIGHASEPEATKPMAGMTGHDALTGVQLLTGVGDFVCRITGANFGGSVDIERLLERSGHAVEHTLLFCAFLGDDIGDTFYVSFG